MKSTFLSLAILASLFTLGTPTLAMASASCDASLQNPCIVQDADETTSQAKHWRTAKMMAEAYKGNTIGLKHMWVSASGVPTFKGFKKIAENIDKLSKGKAKKMIDLDLRQESHLYLNHNAITLTSENNWINLGKSYQQTLADEQAWLLALQSGKMVQNVLTPSQFKHSRYMQGANVSVQSLDSEETVVEKLGFEYARLTISDHTRPLDDDVDRFVTLVKKLPDNVWLHMHCRGGDGRSTTAFAMYDMLKNADKVSFNDIIKRVASVPPNYDLSEIDRKNPEMAKYYVERYQFLMRFYHFAGASLGGYKGNWSEWSKEN